MKVYKKYRKRTNILIFSFLFFACLLSISLFNVIKWAIDSKKTNQEINNINNIATIDIINDNENTTIINPPENKENPYWDYIKMNLISVDFQSLLKKNSQTVGWIQVNGTNINYPFVQTTDNSYYLTHSFDKSYNKAGWVFLDYRNNIKTLNSNTIIYAHSRNDKTMFGSLKNILKSSWYKNKDNYIIKLSTPNENTLWQIFSVYRIKTTSDYLINNFSSNEEYQQFINLINNRSVYPFNTIPNINDKILTLSTCYNDSDKVVMHAKLIKQEKRED